MDGFYNSINTHIRRDPDNNMDYALDLTERLGGLQATGVSVAHSAGVTVTSAEINATPLIYGGVEYPTGSILTFWLSGGAVGVDGSVTFRVMAGARSFDLAYRIVMKNA